MLRFVPSPAVTRVSHSGRRSNGVAGGSLEAYQDSAAAGVGHVQVDVVAIGGGHLASAHRIFGRQRSWESSDIDQIRADGHAVSSLDEVVRALPNMSFNIELKSRTAVPALIATIERLQLQDRVVISTPFHRSIPRVLRRHFGNDLYLCAPLLHGSALGVPIVPLRGTTYQGVQLWAFVTRHRRMLRWAQAQGWDVHMWPVNTPKAEAKFQSWGANVVITDDASQLEPLDW